MFGDIEGGGEIEDNSIDCILTDPPYNISRETNFHTLKGAIRQGMDFGNWDKEFNLTDYISLLPRVLKENSNVVIFNAWENLGEIANVCRDFNITPKRCLVLSKSNPAPFNRENALERCVIPTTVQSSKYHPTMKDLKVMEYLVRVLTNPNDTVLDLFMGSGTTGLACKNLGRDFVGIEVDSKYYNIAKERIYS